jgi:hypothetical protein
MNWVIDTIKRMCAEGFTGRIEINFYCGGITNINKIESIVPPKNEAVSRGYRKVVISSESVL